MALKLSTLKEKSRDQLVELHDQLAVNTVLGLGFYRQEIEWRDQAEASERVETMTRNVEDMTREIRDMTKTIKLLTAAAAGLAVVSIIVSFWALLR